MSERKIIIRKPLLKKYFSLIPMDKDLMQVRSLENIFMMRGESVTEVLPQLIPFLDGKHLIEEIIQKLNNIEPNVIYELLDKLADKFLIEDAQSRDDSELSEEEHMEFSKNIEFLTKFSERQLPDGSVVDKYKIVSKLRESKCLVIGLGNMGISVVSNLANLGVGEIIGVDSAIVDKNNIGNYYTHQEIGIKRSSASIKIINKKHKLVKYLGVNELDDVSLENHVKNSDFVIITMDLAVRSFYEKVNKLCLKYDKSWLSARPGEFEMEIGPLVIPKQTPCFECYTSRLNGAMTFVKENNMFELYKEEFGSNILTTTIEPVYSLVASIISLETLKYLTNILYPITVSRLLTFNIVTMESNLSTVLKIPRCKSCGTLRERPSTAPYSVFLS